MIQTFGAFAPTVITLYKRQAMSHALIQTSRDGVIATVLIDREAKRNCLDLPMWVALGETLAALSADEAFLKIDV